MSSSLLEQLPTEVLDMIFSNITVKIDLSALCLVSRRLSQIATPYLYRNLELRDFNSASRGWAGFSTSVTNFLSSSGISSIRSLTLGIGDDFDALSRPLNGLILQLIPDSLYRFQYDCSHRPSSQELWYLWKTQRRLTNLQLDFTLSPYAEVIQKAKTEFAGATKGRHIGPSRSIHTAVWFDGIKLKPAAVKEFLQPEYALYDAYSLWRAVKDNLQDLRALTDIREVQVSFNLQLLSVSEVEQMLAMILNDRLEKIIYRATNIPTLRSLLQPQALRQLSFHYTDFRDTPAPSERFSSITHLELMECLHVRGLLKWLVLSNLVSLTFQHHDRHGHSPVLGVGVSDVEILLSRIRRVSGLKHFVLDCPICIANFRCKFVAAIMAHKSSLESLLINNCDCIHWKEPSAMCAIYECKYLKQLSIPLHPSTLLAYYRALRINLPDLVVLHISRITDYASTCRSEILMYQLQIVNEYPTIAAKIFSDPTHSPPLSLLALGSRFKQFFQASDMKIYKPVPAAADLALLGPSNVAITAAPVELSRIREIEPNSDLLEFRMKNDSLCNLRLR